MNINLADFVYRPELVPDAIVRHPSMMSQDEKGVLYTLARDYYRGYGVVVDAGLFLGASSRAFAYGIKAGGRPHPDHPVHSYDIAIWAAGMAKYLDRPKVKVALKGMTPPKHGASFEPILRSLLGDCLDVVDLRIGDITRTARAEQPVEIAFYDCLKTYDRDWAAFRTFGKWYVPGHTLVLQQDYFFWTAYDHRIRQEFMADHFEYVGCVKSMAMFRYVKPVPEAWFERDPVLELDAATKASLLETAATRADIAEGRIMTRISLAEFYLDSDMPDAAGALLAELRREIADNAAGDGKLTPLVDALDRRIGA